MAETLERTEAEVLAPALESALWDQNEQPDCPGEGLYIHVNSLTDVTLDGRVNLVRLAETVLKHRSNNG